MTTSSGEYCLIFHHNQPSQPVLEKYLQLMLNYEYGLELLSADSAGALAFNLNTFGDGLCGLFLILDREEDRDLLATVRERVPNAPLFILAAEVQTPSYAPFCQEDGNAWACAWEKAFRSHDASLAQRVREVFERDGVERILEDVKVLSYEALQARLEQKLQKLKTLPTLPTIVSHIMKLVEDPESRIEDLEELLSTDPAIVSKILQVVSTPTFSGAGRSQDWTLQDAIVRLGLKQVGALAQQIELMNSLVKPGESSFDMRRFWEHSVGCAVLAKKLYASPALTLPEEIDFNDYWMAALLHDVGKLILGFFFRHRFEDVIEHMEREQLSFRRAEAALDDAGNHEQIGRLFLLKANAGPRLMNAVGEHHAMGSAPGALGCLVHMADNLAKDLGLGYARDERGAYSASVLRQLRLRKGDILALQKEFGPAVEEVKELVNRCI